MGVAAGLTTIWRMLISLVLATVAGAIAGWMARRRLGLGRYLTFGALGAALVAGWLFIRPFGPPPFDEWQFSAAVWAQRRDGVMETLNSPRGAMVGDLQRRHVLPGMTREQVVRLLGEPDWQKCRMEYVYFIGAWDAVRFVDPSIFIIYFDATGIVRETVIGTA
jgi:outer membrane protein assembly factor BamE (lipoprotein component of BamABCDE complex)